MSLENQVARVSQGTKDTLKTLINKLGGNVTDELIDQYPTIASALDEVDPAGSAQQALNDAKEYTDQKISDHTSDTIVHITSDERTAWNSKASGTHASQHASSGDDPITPADIGLDKSALLKSVEAQLPRSIGWESVAYGDGRFVAISQYSTIAAYSDDGVTWNKTTMPSSVYWNSVTYGNGRFVAVAGSSATGAYSDDGITWTETDLGFSAGWNSVTYGNGRFVAVSNGSLALYSDDGITWTDSDLPYTDQWISVAYGNSRFVAVTESSGIVAYSDDGITWTEASIADSPSFSSVTYGNGRFVAISDLYSTEAYSDDGINWTVTNVSVDAPFSSIIYGNGRFVAVSYYTSIAIYSDDGVTWTQTTIPSDNQWVSVTYGNNRFVTVGDDSSISAYSYDGITWYNTIDVITYPDGTNIEDRIKNVLGVAPSTHASQHASDGSDPITPESIGAAPAYTYGTEDLIAGTSELKTGKLYFVYE